MEPKMESLAAKDDHPPSSCLLYTRLLLVSKLLVSAGYPFSMAVFLEEHGRPPGRRENLQKERFSHLPLNADIIHTHRWMLMSMEQQPLVLTGQDCIIAIRESWSGVPELSETMRQILVPNHWATRVPISLNANCSYLIHVKKLGRVPHHTTFVWGLIMHSRYAGSCKRFARKCRCAQRPWQCTTCSKLLGFSMRRFHFSEKQVPKEWNRRAGLSADKIWVILS